MLTNRLISLIAYCACFVVLLGFWLHTCNEVEWFGKYSRDYLVQLCAVSVIAIVVLIALLKLLSEDFKENGNSPRRRVRIMALCVFLGSLIVTLEIVLTTFHRVELHKERQDRREKFSTFHPYLQVSAAPGDEKLNINRFGFRGEEIEKNKPNNTYRIFFIGGSTVFCSRVKFEQSHCRLLEKKLRAAYPDQRIELQNAGYDWHTTQHSLIKFLFKIQEFDPDLIIVIHAINDVYQSFSPPRYSFASEFQPDYSHFHGPNLNMLQEYFLNDPPPRFLVLNKTIRFFSNHWYSDFRVAPNMRRSKERREWHPKATELDIDQFPSLHTFQRNLTDLARTIRSKNIDLLIASQPSIYRYDMRVEELEKLIFPIYLCRNTEECASVRSLIRAIDTFNRTSRQIADEHEVTFVALESKIPKSLKYFVDDVHYTVEGNRLVADILFDAIWTAGFIK